MKDEVKHKVIIFFVSLALTGLSVALFFLDDSLDWCVEKIISCVFVNLWLFCVIPSFRRTYLINEKKSVVEWFRIGMAFGASRICLPLLFAPIYGLFYYVNL